VDEEDSSRVVKVFEGSWYLIASDGAWKLNRAVIRPVGPPTLKELFGRYPGLQSLMAYWRCARTWKGEDPNRWPDFKEHARKIWYASTGTYIELPSEPPLGWPDDPAIGFQMVGQGGCLPLDPQLRQLPGPTPTPTPAWGPVSFGPYNLGHAGEAHSVSRIDLGELKAGTVLDITIQVGYSASINYLFGEPDISFSIGNDKGFRQDFGRVPNGYRVTWTVTETANWYLFLDNSHSRLAGKNVTLLVSMLR
jgi:hypothetical protein